MKKQIIAGAAFSLLFSSSLGVYSGSILEEPNFLQVVHANEVKEESNNYIWKIGDKEFNRKQELIEYLESNQMKDVATVLADDKEQGGEVAENGDILTKWRLIAKGSEGQIPEYKEREGFVITQVKKATRTIRYVDTNGKEVAPSHTETITFEKKFTVKYKMSESSRVINYVMEGTNEQVAPSVKHIIRHERAIITPSEWGAENDTYNKVVSPQVEGMTPDKEEVPSEKVIMTDEDKEVVVVYKETPKQPEQKPDIDEEKPKEEPRVEEPKIEEEPKKEIPPKKEEPKELPKTGEASSIASLLGTGLLSSFGYYGFRRRK